MWLWSLPQLEQPVVFDSTDFGLSELLATRSHHRPRTDLDWTMANRDRCHSRLGSDWHERRRGRGRLFVVAMVH